MNPENFDEGDTQVAPPGGFKKIGCGLMVAKTKSGEMERILPAPRKEVKAFLGGEDGS